MRKALNENPMVQLAVLGVGGILLAILLISSLSGGGSSSSETAADDPAATATPAPAPATADPATATPAPDATATATPETTTTAPPADSGSADGLLPSAGLPEDVLVAYAKNQAIALLVIDPKAVSDKQVAQYSDVLKSRKDVEYFEVKSKDIADYARITQGVSISRTPSLIVIRPRDKTEGAPTAVVVEGFRDADSIETALEDALYSGPDEPSYPE